MPPRDLELASRIAGAFASSVNNMRQTLLNLFGVKLSRNEEPGWLTFDNPGRVVLATGATAQNGNMTVDSTYDFIAAGVATVAHIVGDARAWDRPFRWDVQVSSNDRHLTNFPAHSDFLGGRHQDGFLWFPKLAYLARNSTVVWTLDSLSSDNLWVYCAFVGYRIYDESLQDLT
jgi:hypothetical protein